MEGCFMDEKIGKLIARGVEIPAPESVVLEDVDISKIGSGVKLYPGTVLRGDIFIGSQTEVGAGGGALVENCYIGRGAKLMQGSYRDSTLLDGVEIRGGAEIRDNCVLEEGVSLGHTCGLKQTILFSHVVLGSLINFCDAMLCGGTGRKDHSEVGSCMALYNFTPHGDKFASRFGDAVRGIFLNQRPVFIGGQTQIVSPVRVGFGCVVAAGSKLSHDLPDGMMVSEPARAMEANFSPHVLYGPQRKVEATVDYIHNLEILKIWYRHVRLPYADANHRSLYESALNRIKNCIGERKKRLLKYIEKIEASMRFHESAHNDKQVASHKNALEIYKNFHDIGHIEPVKFSFPEIVLELKKYQGSYPDAIAGLPRTMVQSFMDEMMGYI